MACGCPAWKNYRDTEEVCDLPVSDGSIFFLVGVDEELSIRTYNEIYSFVDCCSGGCSEPVYPEMGPGSSPWAFDTSLLNPELGEWRYEFTGNFVAATVDELAYGSNPEGLDLFLSIDDCVVIDLIDDGGGVFHWECEALNPSIFSEQSSGVPCNGSLFEVERNLWGGVLDIYYTINGIEYGPITITADTEHVYNVDPV